MKQKCKYCEYYYLYKNQQSLCYYGDEVNIFMFGPKRTSPNDFCKNFKARQLQNTK